MASHTNSAVKRLEVVDTGRRRRWSDEEKARIVLESVSGPRLVSATARRHGVSRSLLVTWRRALGFERRGSDTAFVPAVIAAEAPAAPSEAAPVGGAANTKTSRLEIALTNGRRVIVDTGVDVEALGRIVAALDRR